MKKILALTLAVLLLVGVFAACTPADEASVYFLNFKPEADEAWQTLAATYTEETGVPVTVVTAASGEYETTFAAEVGKEDPPTLFQVNGPVGLKNNLDLCYDLSGSEFYGELVSDNYAIKTGEEVSAVAYLIESYGIITNVTLLQEAGYTLDDVQSFDDLKAVAEDITARTAELGFSAFSSAGMDGSSDWRFKTHLANLPVYFEYLDDGINTTEAIKGTYLDNYRAIWDLYINNSTADPAEISAKTGDDSRNEFIAGEAVFFQNGSWEYNSLIDSGYTADDLAMIPVYVGAGDEANQGLCTGTENYWCVNKNASEADIQATLDFMYWCVSSEAGTNAMGTEMGFSLPFKNAIESPNLFVKQDVDNTAAGKTPVSWNFTTMPSEEWKNGVGGTLTAYAADQTDANWDLVVAAFVDGWATEYALVNG